MGGWASSDRRARLPKDWHKRRAIARRSAGGQCQWVEDGRRCLMPGADCDHIDRHGSDDQANLQWLCRPHHNIKTAAEAASSRLSPRRAQAKHPGLR